MSGDPARASLDAELLGWMAEPWRNDDTRFEKTARALFSHQFAHCRPYARFCRGRGITPDSIGSWEEIPAVPAGAFKELTLRSFPAEAECHVFRTSGTSTEARGALHIDTLALYEASLLPSFERFVLPGLPRAARVYVLTASPEEQPDSSLSHMFGVAVAARGDASSGFFVRRGTLQFDSLLSALASNDAPVALCGTAFSFVHLLDALEAGGQRIQLPPGSRVMETGGFKGRAREIPRDELYEALGAALGISTDCIVNQYGMTELASQFYDTTVHEPGAPRRKLGPPWARVRILEPQTGAPCAPGDVGAIVLHDLANTGSVAAIQTADLGRTVGNGFEVIGREPGAEARGCSIALDEMLERE